MARPPSSKDGRPRVQLSSTISAKAHDFLTATTASLKKVNPNAAIGQSIDSLVDFAEARRFDPIGKIKRPAKRFDTSAGQVTATPSGTKG
jgi:hypothetical protein